MPPLSGLMAEAAALRRRAKILKSELRDLEEKQASDPAAIGRPPSPWMRAVALKVFVLCGCFADAAVAYLESKGRRVEARHVQAWFDGLSAEDAAAVTSPPVDDARAARQLAEAKRFVAETDLVTWVQQQNEVKGIAPTHQGRCSTMLRRVWVFAAVARSSGGECVASWLAGVAARACSLVVTGCRRRPSKRRLAGPAATLGLSFLG